MESGAKCDCKHCHDADDLKQALRRLEDRDEANARIINEMYAKIAQLTDFMISRLKERSKQRPVDTKSA